MQRHNHCNNCNSTYTANRGSGNYIYCGSSDVRGGGCGREHMAVHMVREQTVDRSAPRTPLPTTYVTGTVNGRVTRSNRTTFAFRITYDGLKNDSAVNNYEQAARRIPNLEIGYRANSDGINFYRPNRLVSSADSKNETFFGARSFEIYLHPEDVNNPRTVATGFSTLPRGSRRYRGGLLPRGSTVKVGPVIRQASSSHQISPQQGVCVHLRQEDGLHRSHTFRATLGRDGECHVWTAARWLTHTTEVETPPADTARART